MQSNSEASYAELAARTSPAPGSSLPLDAQRASAQFNVFRVEDLMRGYHHRPPMAFGRRAFYKISLLRGRSRVEYADQGAEINQHGLWFATSRVPYRWLPHDADQAGYYCLFTEEFLLPTNGAAILQQLPIFQPGSCPVWEISAADYEAIAAIFEKMTQEVASGYAYRYELLRAQLLELIYLGQKLQPAAAPVLAHNAAGRLVALFTDLLERQFPLATPQQQLRLRTATDYANHLAVHVNHLNRVLKETTGSTTTALISSRVAQEAKLLLKQTSWTVSEIADCLGFVDVAHFCNFFKRQTGLIPGALRA